jgi:hypothetical protein
VGRISVITAARVGAMALCLLSGMFAGTRPARARDETGILEVGERFNVKSPTLGGLQMWTDELIFRDWRIQRNAMTDHYRLLDDRNQRRAWGTFEQCRAKLEELKRQLQLPPVRGPVVIALHGITRSRNSMKELCEYLQDQGEWTVLNVSYASTRDDLDAHAAALGRIIDHLDAEVTEIYFVAHSLGNLVVRRYLHEAYQQADGGGADPRIRRIVMLTPPNNGARLATLFRSTSLLKWVWGKSAVQLAEEWDSLDQRLATPRCEFGIIAGGLGDERGRSPLIGGDDDWVVGVEETKLAGARDFLVLPLFHSRTMRHEAVPECTLRFLQHGYFVSEDQRQPLPPVQAWGS